MPSPNINGSFRLSSALNKPNPCKKLARTQDLEKKKGEQFAENEFFLPEKSQRNRGRLYDEGKHLIWDEGCRKKGRFCSKKEQAQKEEVEKKECPGEVLVPKWVQHKNKENQFIVLIFTGKIQKNIFTISRLIWPEKRRDSNFPAEAPPMARAAPPRHPWPSNYH